MIIPCNSHQKRHVTHNKQINAKKKERGAILYASRPSSRHSIRSTDCFHALLFVNRIVAGNVTVLLVHFVSLVV